jgi:hypothetical protein
MDGGRPRRVLGELVDLQLNDDAINGRPRRPFDNGPFDSMPPLIAKFPTIADWLVKISHFL